MERNPSPATPERQAFYGRMAPHHLTPLWEVLRGLITPEPKSEARPAHWSYRDIRPFLIESGQIISAKEAERRVLILENPGLQGQSRITTSLYAGLQMILPGEVAPAHRHAQSALRFVLEGSGGFTAVDGERTMMHPGDFVITPSWTWHDHGHDGSGPMVWLDGLDIPLVQFLDCSFSEGYGAEAHPLTRPEGTSSARFGGGLMPVDYEPASPTSPVFNYPYARTRDILEKANRDAAPDACHGYKMQYINPLTGDYAMPTIAAFMQLLPKGFATEPYRASDATVFTIVEGRGRTQIGEQVFHWQPKDIFVIPSWQKYWHHAEDTAVIFSFSDRPIQKKLGLWREDRGNH